MNSIFAEGLLAGRSALVTGGGSGIGAGIARLFARHGARVALLGRTAAKLEAVRGEIEGAGGSALTLSADVRDYSAVEAAVARAAADLGGLDILVNSAAGNFLAPAAALSAGGFRAVVDIDLCGTFNACRAAFAYLSLRKGCVVNISATQAFVPTPLQAHAGAAKAGIEKLTRDLALEWAQVGVRVNSVIPGPIAGTEGMRRLAPESVRERMMVNERARPEAQTAQEEAPPPAAARSRPIVPLGRWGEIDEVAGVVLFLTTPASAYITGASILIDGGMSLMGAARFFELM